MGVSELLKDLEYELRLAAVCIVNAKRTNNVYPSH